MQDAIAHQCQYLLVDQAGDSEQVYSELAALKQLMVTIRETVKFVGHGGLMSLRAESNKIKINISRRQYKQSSIKFGARLLRFANFTR